MSEPSAGNPENVAESGVPPLVDQHEIDVLLAQAKRQGGPAKSAPPGLGGPVYPPLPPFVPGNDLGLLTQREIDTALAAARGATPDLPPVIGQSEIDKLLAAAEAEPTNFAAAEAALRQIDQAELQAAMSAGNVELEGTEAPLADVQDGALSQGELDKLLASVEPEKLLDTGELDSVLAPQESSTPVEPAIRADAAPVTLGPAELDALLAAHPLVREEAPAPLPVMREPKEDPLERAARENAQANIGRENIAAAAPDPAASEQPLGQDLIDSLLAQAAQAAATTAPPAAAGQGAELKAPETGAATLSEEDFADMGISMPVPQSSVVSEPADDPPPVAEDQSPVVKRRLRTPGRFPAKLFATIAASLIVGSTTFGYLWSHRTGPAAHPTEATPAVPPNLEDAIALARELMGKGENVAAMRELGAAIRMSGPSPLLNEARFLHVEAGYRSLPPNPKEVDVETVLKNIEDVIALAPDYSRNAEALGWKAELYERTGAMTLARDTYERLLTTYPQTPGADYALLQQARLSFRLNYFEDAQKALGRIVSEFPESTHKSEAQMMLGQCYEATGRVADAQAVYAAVAAERTESRAGAEAALALARIAQAAGDTKAAIQALEARLQTATTVDGNDAVYVELAKAYRAAGRPADAVRIARELLNFFPDSERVPDAVVELTKSLEANGEPRQALELAQQAADRFDKNAEVAKNRAVLLSKTNDTRAAAEALEKADELGANDPAILFEASQKYMELKESEKAVKILQRVIETYPESPQAIEAGVELGRYEYKTGNVAGAIDRLAALADSPKASAKQLAVQAALGDIYSDLGLSKRATAAYEKVAALANDPEMLARAATVLLENGAIGPALPVVRKVDLARLSSKTGFTFLMAQGRAMLDLEPEVALAKMQEAFERYPVERSPEDFEYLVRACLQTGKTAHARVLVSDFDIYVQKHPEDRERLQRTAVIWGDALYNTGDYRGALEAYALASAPPPASRPADEAQKPDDAAQNDEPSAPSRDVVWAKFQRANAMLKLDDYASSLPIFEELASSDTPYAEDARIKAAYARLEQRIRGGQPGVNEGG